MRSAVVVAAAVFASCSAPPPATTAERAMPTAPVTTKPSTLAEPPKATQGPMPDADVPGVKAGLVGTWETTVKFPGDKSATQTLTFTDDGRYTQVDSGTEKETKTAAGQWSVVDGKPLQFTLLLTLGDIKTAKTWQLLDATHLVTHAAMSDIVYVKKP